VDVAGIPSPHPLARLLAHFEELGLRLLGAPSPLQGEVGKPEVCPAAVRAIVPLRGTGERREGRSISLGPQTILKSPPLVNGAPQRRRSPVEGGSTHVVVGET